MLSNIYKLLIFVPETITDSSANCFHRAKIQIKIETNNGYTKKNYSSTSWQRR